MIGKYHIEVSYKKIKYEMDINRNITIIKGDSGTGKTTLFNLIKDSEVDNRIKIRSKVNVMALYESKYVEEILEKTKNSIIIIDESSILFKYKNFAELLKKSDNYFILITREKLGMLPYSYKEIYELINIDGINKFNRIYGNFENNKIPVYDEEGYNILVEDSKSNYIFMKYVIEKSNIDSACGKSNIYNKLKVSKYDLVVADGAAIGSEIEDILKIKKINIYLPESFEFLLLKSCIYSDASNRKIKSMLKSPSEYIDSKIFFSWENFFYFFLKEIAKENRFSYSKDEMNKYFTNKIDKIIDSFSNDILILRFEEILDWS